MKFIETLTYKINCTWKEYIWQSNLKELKKSILSYFDAHPSDDKEISTAVSYLRRHAISTFPAKFAEKYKEEDIVVEKDAKNGLLYVLQDGKKLYFKRSYNVTTVRKLYNGLRMEQDEQSPHRYMDSSFCVADGDVFFDIGSAEGNMLLANIEKVSHAVLFERDKGWIEALQATFAPWREKVTIVDRYVSDRDDEINVSIDSFLKTYNMRPNFIKMDVEGAEQTVLQGMQQLLSSGNLKVALCTYHQYGDYDTFYQTFTEKGATVTPSKGVMLFLNDTKGMKPPYFRKGLLRITIP